MTFHFFDRVAVAFVFEGLSQVRDALQTSQDESGEGLESGVARQEQAVLSFEVADVDCAFEDQHGFILQLGLGWRHVEFVFDVPD